MIFTLLSLLIMVYGCIDFKKGLMYFTIYYLFWFSTTVFSVGGMSVNTTVLVCGWYLFLYYINYFIFRMKTNPDPFPYAFPFVLIIVSYLASSFTALSSFGTELARGVRIILLPYVITWLLWNTCFKKHDLIFLFKGITIVMLFACLFGLLESVIQSNFLLNYKVNLSGGALEIYDANRLRGYRLSSIFEHPIGGGMTFGLYFAFVFTIITKTNYKLPLKRIAIITAFLCLPCVILSKMRSAMLFTAICSLNIIDLKGLSRKRKLQIIIICSLGVPMLLFLMRDQLYIITSMFSVERSSEVGGSSLSMRLNQLEAVKQIYLRSPAFGLGETFRSYIENSSVIESALGFESVWFEQITMHGIVGVLAQVLLMYYTVFKIPIKNHSRSAAIFACAYWITYTVTSITSFRVVIFFVSEFFLLRISDMKNNKEAYFNNLLSYKMGKSYIVNISRNVQIKR